MSKKTIVVLTGAGISAESGIKTFRDSGGLWEGYDVMKVASPEGWQEDPSVVIDFYNKRRKNVTDAQPNEGHKALVRLEEKFNVVIITQNIDDLHERAGSSNIIHLHGEVTKIRSSKDPDLLYDCKEDLKLGDNCKLGSQLRPHVVWFGEAVPMMEVAVEEVRKADHIMIIGTSMVVYPAASLINFVGDEVAKYFIDPNIPEMSYIPNLQTVAENASTGVPQVVAQLLAQ